MTAPPKAEVKGKRKGKRKLKLGPGEKPKDSRSLRSRPPFDKTVEQIVLSPPEEVRGPWTPLAAYTGVKGFEGGSVQITLDGKAWSDPVGFLRQRMYGYPGSQYVGQLDLSGLEPGEHEVVITFVSASGDPAPVTAKRTFTYVRGVHRIDLRVRDAAGKPTAARVHVLNDEGQVTLGTVPMAFDPQGRGRDITSVMVTEGSGTLWLDPGTYRLAALRSVLDDVGLAEITVDGPGKTTVDLVVNDGVVLPGWFTADLHVHSGHSGDSHVPDRVRVESLVAAGLDVAVITDHIRPFDPRPLHKALNPKVDLVPGAELGLVKPGTKKALAAHYNVYPIEPWTSAIFPTDATPAQRLAHLRKRQTETPFEGEARVVLQLNHPRGIEFVPHAGSLSGVHALFNLWRYDRKVPVGQGSNAWMTPEALDYDTIEVINRFSWDLYRSVRLDWYALWAQGIEMTGTGNSDTHALNVELAGWPVNLIQGASRGEDVPAKVLVDGLTSARVLVSTGPVVQVTVNGVGSGGMASRTPGEPLEAVVTVDAPPWVPVHELRLIVNGNLTRRIAVDPKITEVRRGSWTIPIPDRFTSDAFITAEAGWPLASVDSHVGGLYEELAPGYVPIGFSNPIKLDLDGDGVYTPPGFESLRTDRAKGKGKGKGRRKGKGKARGFQ